MGYTHYFQQNKSVPDVEWNALCADVKKLYQWTQQNHPNWMTGDPYGEDSQEVQATESKIVFNGVDDCGYETFWIDKQARKFNFCKTNRNEYDVIVVSVLLLMEYHAGDCFSISSDGELEDWMEGVALNEKLFGYGCKVPESISR